MLTLLITTLIVTMLYGLAWHNQPAKGSPGATTFPNQTAGATTDDAGGKTQLEC
jgi:hypothetical protein